MAPRDEPDPEVPEKTWMGDLIATLDAVLHGIHPQLERLLAEEGLTEPATLLERPVLDEVPLCSRLSRIGFLARLESVEREQLLLAAALRLLLRTLSLRANRSQGDAGAIDPVLCVSVIDDAEAPWDFATPCVFVLPREDASRSGLRVSRVSRPFAKRMQGHLEAMGLANELWVLEPTAVWDVDRAYIVPREGLPGSAPSLLEYLTAEASPPEQTSGC